ncbi:MAG TPA: MarR family transcriptional regulator [Jatrophihabitans sp.]|nr:MarR family transcriptional regulator [Jatrophihabitans sp.]
MVGAATCAYTSSISAVLSPSGLTRLVGRLERAGWLNRRQDDVDARSFLARLTPGGAKALRAARATHNAVIRELYLDRLNPTHRRALSRAWRAVHGE